MSFSVTFHHSFIAGLPFSFIAPVASSVAAPELMRWMKPFFAPPVGFQPVARFTASGLQNVRTSAKSCARFVRRCMRSIETPLSVSFSVANVNGSRGPFQSKEVLSHASAKSPFGQWSVHWR